ncbi:MAG: hypothetical protein GY778_13820 [bacterium]|nr:hypothetical protein [bacterium]
MSLLIFATSTGCAQREPWTIQCLELAGAGAVENAGQIAQTLRETPGIDPGRVRVETTADGAGIYYGTYQRAIDAKTGDRNIPNKLRDDLILLKELADPQGRRFFLHARIVPAPEPDAGKPEWNLRQAEGIYTLQVAVYYNTDQMRDRKKAAAEKTRQLRGKGLEAYFYHGVSRSMVTVGTFGVDALLDEHGRVRYIRVGREQRQVTHHYSPEVVKLQAHPECKYNLTNDDTWYDVDEHTQKRYVVRSKLVTIPREEAQP